ncbi:MAG: hypothetical protein H7175_10115, partial [Burkholderiales bacterium]|nr:hypothetical protein [Anaerolineae bacterium]
QVITAVHQNHDYSHTSANARTGTEAQRNMQLANAGFYRSLQYGIHDATHILTRDGIQPNVSRPLSGMARLIRRIRLTVRGTLLSFIATSDRTQRQQLIKQPEALGENSTF